MKAQLTKAVDGAALGAARHLNSGNPRAEAEQIFKANFPAGYMGTSSSTDPTTAGDFFTMVTDAVNGVNNVTITATAVLPTTFMKLGEFRAGHRQQRRRGDAANGGLVAGDGRVQLDRMAMALRRDAARTFVGRVRRRPTIESA